MIHRKGVIYILFAFISALQCLLRRISFPGNMSCIYRYSCYLADSSGNIFRLVIPPFAQSYWMQRNRHNYIDSIEEIRILHLQSCHSPELITYHRLIGILHLMDSLLDRMIFLIKKKCRSSHQMHGFPCRYGIIHISDQCLLHTIPTKLRLLRSRQRAETYFA